MTAPQKLFKILLLSLCIAFQLQAQVPSYVPTSSLVAWYPYSGNANDASPNLNNGLVNGATVTQDRFGNPSSAYNFNNATISHSTQIIPSNSSFALSFWVRPNTPGIQEFFSQNFWPGAFYVGLNGTEMRCGDYWQATGVYPTMNAWEHYVIVRDLGVNVKIYRNGILVATKPTDITLGGSLSDPLIVGKSYGSNTYYYSGRFDDFGIWNRTLSSCEVQNLYNTPSFTTALSTQSICAGQTLTLSAGGAPNYTWSTGALSSSVVVSPTSSVIYTVSSTYTTSCIDTRTISVTVSPIPTVNAGADQLIFSGSQATLSGSGATTYTWSNGLSNGVPFTVNSTSIYTLTGATNGCSASDQVLITVMPQPTIMASNTSICAGQSASLSAVVSSGSLVCGSSGLPGTLNNGLVGYWPFCGNVNDASGNGYNGTVNGAALTADRFGNANSSYSFSSSNNNYVGTSFPGLGQNLGRAFSLWTNGTNGSLLSYGGQYDLPCPPYGDAFAIIKTGNLIEVNVDCSSWVYVIPNYAANTWYHFAVTFPNNVNNLNGVQVYCNGILLNVNSTQGNGTFSTILDLPVNFGRCHRGNNYYTGKIDDIGAWNRALSSTEITQLYNQGQASYSWSPGGATTRSISVSPTITTTYTCNITLNGASTTQTQAITVNTLPTIFITGSNTLCAGGSLNLSAGGASTYTWSTASNASSIAVSPSVNTTYSLNGTSAFGCLNSTTATLTLTVIPIPTVNAGADQTLFSGSQATFSGSGATTYTWSNGLSNGVPFTVNSTSIYTLTGATNGCSASDQVLITVMPQPTISASNNTICVGQSAGLTAAVSSASIVCGSSGLPGTLNNGLVGYWPFCGNANDASGNGNNGINSGAALTTDRYSNNNSAYYFNGASQIDISGPITIASSGNNQASISTWFLIPTIHNSNSYLAGYGNPNQQNGQIFAIGEYGSNGIFSTFYGGSYDAISNIAYPLNSWHNITVVKSTNGLLSFYLDAVLIYSQTVSTPNIGNSSGRFGRAIWNSNEFFVGKLDDIGIWNRALTQQEITQLYNQGQASYSWSPGGATTASISVSPTITTTYTCNITLNGASTTQTQVITVNANPSITVNSGAICAGQNFTISPAGANTYTIQGGSAVVSPSANTSYTVLGTNTLGCMSQAYATSAITVQALPTVFISGTGALCVGGSLNLIAGGATTYTWSTASNANTITVSPSVNTTYSLIGTSSVGCVGANPAVQVVTVNTLPTVAISGTNAVCAGGSLSLSAGGANTYTWSTSSNASSISVSPSTNTTYSLTGSSAFGCLSANTATMAVTVNTLPIVAITGTNALCAGASVNLSAGGANTYTWSNASNASSIAVSPSVNTTYSLTGTSSAGCLAASPAVQAVTVNPLPNVFIYAVTGTLCSGGSINLGTVGANTYTWSTASNANSITVSPTVNTTYSLTGTSSAGCVVASPAVKVVTVNTLPIVVIGGTNALCAGASVNLNAAGANTYTWSNSSNSNTITVSPNVNTTYSLAGTSSAGCVSANTATLAVTVNTLPIVVISGTNALCAGDAINLTAGGANTYTWSTASTANNINVSPALSTTYSLTGSTAFGCVSANTATLAVTVNTLPIVAISGTNALCAGGSINLSAGGANTYTWSTASNANNINVSPALNTTYILTGSTAFGCVSANTATLAVTVNTLPIVAISGTTALCAGDAINLAASGANTYTWSTASNASSINVSPALNTTYSLTGSTAFGCVSANTATLAVTVNTLPIVAISGTTALCAGDAINLAASGANSYTWSTASNASSINVSPALNTTYSLTGSTAFGCISANTATLAVTVNTLPIVVISGTNALCAGTSVNLSAGGANTYTWSTASNASSINVSPALNTTYSLTGSTAFGCVSANTATLAVTVNTLPIVVISGTNALCAGTSVNLSAGGANTYTWSTASNASSINVSPALNTTYSLTGSTAFGCVSANTATLAVTVNTLPIVAISGTNALCAGGSVNLSAGGANTYTWSTASNASSINVSPALNTTYSLTGSTAFGCVSANTATLAVTVNTLPIVVISGTNALCAGTSVNLSAGGANTYTWSTASNASIINVSPALNTTYSLTGSTAFGCLSANTATLAVTVNTLPIVVISGTNALCAGDAINLAAGGANTYTWSTASNASSINVSPALNTTYSLTGSTAFGCLSANTATLAVTVNTLPIIVISGTNALCAGASVNLSAGGANTYTWSTASNASSINVSPALNTTYSLTGSTAFGCISANTATLAVTVNTLPIVAISGTNALCAGGSANLSAGGANTYTWSTASNASSINVSPALNTTYSLTGSTAFGCVSANTATLAVTVNTLPIVAISGTTALCAGDAINLAASGANTYTWSTASNASSINVSPALNTTYSLTGSTAFGCVSANTATLAVTVNTLPIVAISGTTALCAGDAINLAASGANSYTWSTASNASSINVSPALNTTYSLTGSTAFGCISANTATLAVTVNTLPIVVISGTNALCAGTSVNLSAGGANTYTWSTASNASSINVSPALNTTYSLTGSTAFGCVSANTATLAVTVNTLPIVVISGTTALCAGDAINLAASGANTYTWSTASNASSINVSPALNTTYSLTGSTAFGCVSANTATLAVTVNTLPIVAISGTTALCAGDAINLAASGANTYTWSTTSNASSINVSPALNTTYSLTGSTAFGCISANTATLAVTVNTLPIVVISGTNALCAGASVNLSAGGANTYTWSTASNASSINVSPSVNTSYSLTGSSVFGCLSNNAATLGLTVNPNPTLTLSGATGICTGQTASLTVSGASTYSWSTGSTNTAIVTSPTVSTTYSITGASALGCSTSTNQLVTVQASLSISVVGPTAVCYGQVASLNSLGGATYTWNTGATTSTIAPSLMSTTAFTVLGASGNCSSTAFYTVAVNPNPTVTITGSTSICNSQTATLSASGATTYSWTSGATSSTAALTPSTSTNYSVTGSFSTGCNNTQTTAITVYNLPTVSISGNGFICSGDTTILTVSGATTYSWSNTASSNTISVSPTANQSYIATGTDANGCINNGAITVTVNARPTLSLTGNTAICAGESQTLSVTGANTYTWNTGSNSNSMVVTPSMTVGNYAFSVIASSSVGCTKSLVDSVLVNAIPSLSIAGGNYVCNGNTLTLNASGASTYTWNTGSAGNSIAVSPIVNTTYSVVGSSTAGCNSSAINSVTVVAYPLLSITGNTVMCFGDSLTLVANGANSYTWSTTGATNSVVVIKPTASITYTLIGEIASGCSDTIQTNITVNALPNLSLTVSSNTICLGEMKTIWISGANTYTWSTAATTASISVSPTMTTTYSVIGVDLNNCLSKDSVIMAVSMCNAINEESVSTNFTKVYPSPNQGLFVIEMPESADAEIHITNMIGQKILRIKAKSINSIDLLRFDNGIYFIHVLQNNRIVYSTSVIKE